MKNFIYSIWSKFLTFFGDVKVFRFPMWIVYDPNFFGVTGEKIMEIVQKLKPGDVILRGYQSYLDSKFINGDYSHAGVYVGDNKVIHAISPSVQEINVIDFVECDRIAICRPKKYVDQGIINAQNFLEKKIPYDFSFNTKDVNALYCFELAANCYPNADIKTFEIKKFMGLVRKTVYLGESFKESPDFQLVFEFNPLRHIDISI